MKRLLFVAFSACVLAGCASTPPPPIEPQGEVRPVNPDNLKRSDLRVN